MLSLSEEENSMKVSTQVSQDPNLGVDISLLPKFHVQGPSYHQGRVASELALLEDERMDCFLVGNCSLCPQNCLD